MKKDPFSAIRPYKDEELPYAVNRILMNQGFIHSLANFITDASLPATVKRIRKIKTCREMQEEIFAPMIRTFVQRSVDELTYGGFENLDKNKSYLFIANHRDILLDSALMQLYLINNGLPTTRSAIGDNLLSAPIYTDIAKISNMFTVIRANTPRTMLINSTLMSEYIRHSICKEKISVWIAQRNGRTKDGVDRTDQGVIKMFGMSGPKDRVEALSELNIVPVSVSYEWEPCDTLKTLEIYATGNGKPYVKRPGEDMNSILTGILQEKGRVHFQICEPLKRDELEAFKDMPHSQFHRSVAKLIDRRICGGYRLFPNAYIAHDIRYGKAEYVDRYTKEQYDAFLNHMARLYDINANDVLKDIFLGIYCNPIASK